MPHLRGRLPTIHRASDNDPLAGADLVDDRPDGHKGRPCKRFNNARPIYRTTDINDGRMHGDDSHGADTKGFIGFGLNL